MFVADLGGEVAMGLRRLPTLANHCAQRASFALLQGKWIEFRELTYMYMCTRILSPQSFSQVANITLIKPNDAGEG